MPKPLTNEELLELISEGATIRSDKPEESSEKMDMLIGQLQAVVDSNQAIVEEHRSQMTTLLDKLVDQLRAQKVNYEPFANLIKEMRMAEHKPRPAYEFKVNRNSRGLIDTVEVVPHETPKVLN
jgi:hypothetical protein